MKVNSPVPDVGNVETSTPPEVAKTEPVGLAFVPGVPVDA